MQRRPYRLLAAGVLACCPAGWLAMAQGPPPPAQEPGANTTVVPRSTAVPSLNGHGQISATAYLTDNSPPITQGLVWRVYGDKSAAGAKPRLVATHRKASPTLWLDPGNYWINVAYGLANLTRKITVAADQLVDERFVLNAGGLRLVPVLANGEPANPKLVAFDVESDERDDYGQRTKVATGARAGVVLRLNAGIYSIVSTYGDANATARGDVSVEAGKLTEVTLGHAAAEVSFKLVARSGGDAIADTQWSVTTSHGEAIKESSGAVPTHILAPGSYVVRAKHAGRSYRRDFAVKAGDRALVEVVMP